MTSFPSDAPRSTGSISGYILGVCAMDKKARSKPMAEIIKRLPPNEFSVIIFGDEMILEKDVEQWPICDALIAFFSGGFPLEKAEAYVRLRNPVIVNDLAKQRLLMDRRDVYRTLKSHDIPVPRHVIVNRDEKNETIQTIVETEDFIEVDGERIYKPFVEKPVDGEDHNIHIYYPLSAGGGCKTLFRKIGNRSSEFHPNENTVRTQESFIYEEFLSTQGTDVKVYTVGPNYAHAEARKSPVLDGKVLRDEHGKEIRYPVILSTEEKEIARKVCLSFEQTVCGFDILRVKQGSYVCDVNGWSFVKNSAKYYEDCSILLRKYLLRALRARLAIPLPSTSEQKTLRSVSLEFDATELDTGKFDEETEEETTVEVEEELRCVIAVIRHGDRTPKQKMKMVVNHSLFLSYYHERVGSNVRTDLKLKAVRDLEELLHVSKRWLELYDTKNQSSSTMEDIEEQIKGIITLRDVLERWQLCGINRKVQLKPKSWERDTDSKETATSILLILKWGGDLTNMGMQQAESLGQRFRHELYPGDSGGLLRLHSTYRHDLKIYTSDEGRVQKTAAAFAKGFLELDGDIVPILVSLVVKEQAEMLEKSGTSAQETIMKVKERLHDIIHRGDDCTSLKKKSQSTLVRSVAAALDDIEQPIGKMERIYQLLKDLKNQLEEMVIDQEEVEPCNRETLPMVAERWAKLYRDFYSPKKNAYDLSKIPDIHDCIRYDAMHNQQLQLVGVRELLDISKLLADTLVPQEYGIDTHEKIEIATDMCRSLLKKIRDDLDIARGLMSYRLDPNFAKDRYIKSAHRSVRTRLYFTSESHLHTLLNVLRYPAGDLACPIQNDQQHWISAIPELCYMTHIVIRVFERFQYNEEDPQRYRVDIRLSPGATGDPITATQPLEVEPSICCSGIGLTVQKFQDYIAQAIDYQKQ